MASPSLRLLATPKFQISPVVRRIKSSPLKSVCAKRARDFRAVKRLDFSDESVAANNCVLKVPEIIINSFYQQKKVIVSLIENCL